MKKVLMVSYHFPPGAGPGVQRVLKYVKYLPEFGWLPVVLTVRNAQYSARDESLLEQVPEQVQVYRTGIPEPYRLYRKFTGGSPDLSPEMEVKSAGGNHSNFRKRLAAKIRASVFIPDARIGWYLSAIKAGKRILREHNIDAIYSSSPPYTCALIAKALQKHSGIPWIMGLRDPWTGFLTSPERNRISASLDRAMERRCLSEARIVEIAWEGIRIDALRKYRTLPKDKFVHIPNGFDPDDYPDKPEAEGKRFVMTYAGSLYGLRNPVPVLDALEKIAGKTDDDIELRIYGRVGSDIKEEIMRHPQAANVHFGGYLGHREILGKLCASSMLLLIVDESPAAADIVPGKIFEYLGTGRPILMLGPEGAAADILTHAGAGKAFHNNDVESIAAFIFDHYLTRSHGDNTGVPARIGESPFNRRLLTGTFARLLNQIAT
jgi:glycosyltransferase involved in cell wall biosynthesis